jgi:hypothetical protein
MNNVAAISQNVKPAACVVLFDAKYLGKFRNRKFGQGIEVKSVEIPVVGKLATDAEYRRHVEETTFSAEEFRLSQRNNITLDEARDILQNFESFCEDRAETMASIDEDAMLEAMASDHDCDESNRYEEAELSEVGILAAIVDESDFAVPAPARHRRVNQAKARRLAVAR